MLNPSISMPAKARRAPARLRAHLPPPPPTFALTKRLLPFLLFFIGVLALLVLTSSDSAQAQEPETQLVPADWALIPADIGGNDLFVPGESFRLLFVTSGNRNATSADIADYNTFVKDAAGGGHADIQAYKDGFRALVSTATVDARDNTATTYTSSDKGVPIYWVDPSNNDHTSGSVPGGAKVADDYEDLYDGDWDSVIPRNQSGSKWSESSIGSAWTGSNADGTARTNRTAGSSFVIAGPFSQGGGAGAINHGNGAADATDTKPLYALSQVLTVVAAPNQVTGLTVTAGGGQLSLSWTEVTGASGYKVQWKSGTEDYDTANRQATTTTTSHVIPNLTAGTAYTVRVIATFPSASDGPFSAEATGTPLAIPQAVPADWALIPEDAGGNDLFVSGESFRLLFVTSGTSQGTSANIADYNTFVKDAAGGGHAAIQAYKDGFRALVSAAALDARDNTATHPNASIPIYWLDGAKVADDYTDFYDDSWQSLEAKDESGQTGGSTRVWTGSNADGTVASSGMGGVTAAIGELTVGQSPLSQGYQSNTAFQRIYALSEVFTVGAPNQQVTGLTVTAGGGQLSLSWTEVTGASGYKVQWKSGTEDYDTANRQATTTTTSHVIPNLTAGIAYTVRISATFPSAADGPFSAEATGTPLAVPHIVPTDWALIPEDTGGSDLFGPGESFRLLFLTSGGTSATSDSIADYNTFVKNAAGGGHAAIQAYKDGFRALVSTDEQDARDNTATTYTSSDKGVPVYWLEPSNNDYTSGSVPGGPKVADDYEDLYDGDWDSIIPRNQLGDRSGFRLAWTGSNADGTAHASRAAGSNWVITGVLNQGGGAGAVNHGNNAAEATDSESLYALSQVLTVAATNQVTGLTATGGIEQLSLSWTAVTGASGYKVQWKSGTENYDTANRQATTTTASHIIPNLTAGTAYTVRVIATFPSAADGPFSAEATGTPLAVPPNQVTGLTVTAGGGQLSLSWTAVTGASGYKVQWKSGTENYDTANRQATTTTSSHIIPNLTAGTVYTVRVIATFASAADGPPSAEATGTPLADPNQVTGLTVTAGGGQLSLSWTAVTGASGYKVQWKSGTENYDTAKRQATTTTTRHIIPNLTAGTVYTVRVIATFPSAADGPPSAEATGTPLAVPRTVPTDWALIPEDAGGNDLFVPGESFRLLFVTSGNRNATSADIADYNTFVKDAAGGGHADIQAYKDGFRALVSTATVDARDNTATTYTSSDKGVPIYWVDPSNNDHTSGSVPGGAKVADDYEDLYDGDWDSVIPRNQSGSKWSESSIGSAWTGSNADGTARTNRTAGSSFVIAGPFSQGGGAGAINHGNGAADATDTKPLYALSQVLTVVAAPNQVTGLTVTAGGGQLSLSWTEVTGASGYKVQWKSGTEDYDTANRQATTTTTSHVIPNLTAGTAYTVRIIATFPSAADGPPSAAATGTPLFDYDADADGLIEVGTLAQLNAIRYDLDGDGMVTDDANTADLDEADAYSNAFPNPVTGMGCPLADHDGDPNTDLQPVCTGYELTADLDFDQNGDDQITSADTAYWNGGSGWDPIGESTNPFDATFDGNGNTISNLFIDRGATDYVGLFGAVASGGAVRNLGVPDAQVQGRIHVGALVGNNLGRVSASWATGSVASTDDSVGGLAGSSEGVIAASYSAASVSATSSGSNNTGGLVGLLSGANASILASYATGSVTGNHDVGGLVGTVNTGAITASYSTGAVSGNDDVGGLVGVGVNATVTNSYWDTERSGLTTSAGGTGKTGAELRAPTDYTGIYANWNLDLDGDGANDNPWDFGANYNYPTLWAAGGKQKGPGPVGGVTAEFTRTGESEIVQLVVSWNAPTDYGDGNPGNVATGAYGSRYSSDGGTVWITRTIRLSAVEQFGTTHTIAGPDAAPYRIEVWAIGHGAAHTEGKRVSISLPGPPQMVRLISFDQRIDASWSAPADTGGSLISGYLLDWRQVGAASWTTLTLSGTTRSFTNLVSGGSYEFRIAATNADGTGPYTQPLSAIASNVVDYDSDGDGLIEIRTLAQLNAVRWDTDGDGMVSDDAGTTNLDESAVYAAAFPQAAAALGCPAGGCTGYELMADLDFDIDGDGDVDADDGRTDSDLDADDDGNADGGAFWNDGDGWRPIGTSDARFIATFEGNGHTIANLFINRAGWDRVGLFGRTGSIDINPAVGATIRNLVLTGASVTGDDRVGILAGETNWTTSISNVTVSGSVTGDDYVGGLIGNVNENIDGNSVSGSGRVTGSSASGSVTATDDHAGGLVGQNEGTIAASYSTATVSATGSGSANTGGLVGTNEGDILASYATGSVSGVDDVGGLVGEVDSGGSINFSYSTGVVSGSGTGVGGLMGSLTDGTVTSSYWDIESSGQTTSVAGTGKTGEELRAPTGYSGIYSAWNLDLDADGTNDDPWDFGESYNYPTLRDAPGKQQGPGPVRDLTATRSAGTTTIRWTAPLRSGDGAITGYEYRVSIDGGSTWDAPGWDLTQGGARSDTFSAQPEDSHTVEVRAVSDAAHQRGVAQRIVPPQNAPQNLSVLLYTGRVDLFWDAPQDDGGPDVTGYAVQYKASSDTTWLTTNVVITGRSAIITSLNSGTTYNVRVAAVSALGVGTYSTAIDATPTVLQRLPGAPTGLTLTPGNRRMEVSWTAPRDLGNTPFFAYSVQYRVEGEPAWRDWTHSNTDTSTTISGLTSDRPYQVQVAAVNVQGTGPYSDIVTQALVRVPGVPGSLEAKPADGSIEALWFPPSDLGLPPLDEYIVQYRQRTDPVGVWKELSHDGSVPPHQGATPKLRITITGLSNGAEYLVRVAAINEQGTGPYTATASATPFGLEDLPGVPKNLRVHPSDARLDVRWDAPDRLGTPPLTHYWVFIREGSSGNWIGGIPRTVDGTSTSTVYKDRKNGQSYLVRVAACNRWGCGYSTSPVAATPQEGLERPDIERPPSAPRNMTLTPGDGQIVVSWKAPTDPGRPADGTYLVEHRKAGTADWTETWTGATTATLTGLTNGQAYEVQVTAYNDYGGGVAGPQSASPGKGSQDPDPEPGDDPERPPTAPRNLTLTAGDGWIKVSWNPSADIGQPDDWLGYVVEIREVGERGWFEEGLYQDTTVTIEATNGQSYQVRVVAVNLHGSATAGPHTARPTAPETDEERPPTAPRNLRLTPGDEQIGVSWEAPWDMGEEDVWLGYIVEFRGPGTGGWFEEGVYKVTSAIILDLENGETYEVRVSAFNLYGQATAGPKRAAVGEPEPPSAPRNLSLTAGDGRIDVSWDAPENLGNPEIEGYNVQHREAGENSWADQQVTGTSATITGLTNGTEYEVRVVASNGHGEAVAGPNRAAPVAEEDPEPGRAPTAPRNLALSAGDGRIEVSWDAPSDLGSPEIEGYTVEYRKVSAESWTSLDATATSATITGLTNGTEYQVRVVASNGQGKAVAGPVGATPEKPEPTRKPGAPRNLSVEEPGEYADGREFIKVSWNAPADPGNPAFTGYQMHYRYLGTDSDRWFEIPAGACNSCSLQIGMREGATEFQVKVRAVNDAGNGPFTDTKRVVIPSDEGTGSAGGEGKAENQPPTANAGSDQQVTEGDTVTLAGKGSDPEGQSLTFAWTAPDGITLSNSAAASPTFTAPDRDEDYTLTFSLVVNDGNSDSEPDTVVISVSVEDDGEDGGAGGEGRADNQPPTANAGPDQSVTEGAVVTLAGKGSDPEGQTLTYSWTAPSGITLSDSAAASPTFTAPDRTADYTLTFSLVVNDGTSDSAADTVAIKVTADDDAPTASAGPDQSVNEGATVTLAGSGSDPEGQALTYSWTAPDGITLSDSAAAKPAFTAPDRDADYSLTFSLVVNDGNSDSVPDTVVISVTVDDEGGAGGQGDEPDPERAPTAPRKLSLTPGDGIIQVSWSASQDLGEPDDWIGYSVESRAVGDEDWFEEGLYQGTTATVQDLENGVEYEVRVLAVNLYGQAVAGPVRATPSAG